jgi:hypothetical protein
VRIDDNPLVVLADQALESGRDRETVSRLPRAAVGRESERRPARVLGRRLSLGARRHARQVRSGPASG